MRRTLPSASNDEPFTIEGSTQDMNLFDFHIEHDGTSVWLEYSRRAASFRLGELCHDGSPLFWLHSVDIARGVFAEYCAAATDLMQAMMEAVEQKAMEEKREADDAAYEKAWQSEWLAEAASEAFRSAART